MPDAATLLDTLLAPRPAVYPTLPAFRAAWHAAAAGWDTPVDRALIGGGSADRLGYAFAAGYTSALERLVPGLVGAACLCVTEEGGAHPRAIRARLTPLDAGWRLDGKKRWATLAGEGDTLLVAASTGHEGDHNVLRLARVPADAPGVTLTALPPTPFTPEIPHYEVTLDGVVLPHDALLPGDGWTAYVKPFRTVEDAHVCAAATAYLLGVARTHAWP
ncbi:MAG: acyl-CoA dehydrogenase family protein, partial [Myxococcota bacterium]